MIIKQLSVVLGLVVAQGVWAVADLVAVPNRLVNIQPASVNGLPGNRVTLGTGRAGEFCYLALNEKSAQAGRFENVNGLKRDQVFTCVRDGVAFELSQDRYSFVAGSIDTNNRITFNARLVANSGQVMDVYTTAPLPLSF